VKPLPSSSTYARWLALVRILTGIMWIAHAVPKFLKSDRFLPPNGAVSSFMSQAMQHTSGPYHAFLAATVAPNIFLFAELVRLGELLTGIALVLGLFTRLGGLVGMFLTANYIAARGMVFSSATLQSLDFTLLVLSAISLVLPTGRAFGIDALRARPRRAVPLVRAEFVPEPPPPPPAASTPRNP
jgi:uncharacterized membrane protein YphA (DoxX/SURF4 family)